MGLRVRQTSLAALLAGLAVLARAEPPAQSAEASSAEASRWKAAAAQEKFNAAVSYMRGANGFEKNATRAAALFTEVGDSGTELAGSALNNLGTAYAFGAGGVAKDEAKAMRMFLRAAELGNLLAEYNLGEIFAEGKVGMAVDLEAAKKWYRRAAEQGDELAQNNLAVILEDAGDLSGARKWLEKASETDAGAMYNLGLFIQSHRSNLFLEKSDRAWNETEALWRRAVEEGLRNPGDDEDNAYEAEDSDIGVFYGSAAAKRASFALGAAYLDRGDAGAAEDWFRRGALQLNDAKSATNLGALLVFQRGEETDAAGQKEGFALLERAARLGEPRAAACLGLAALEPGSANATAAERWLREAARRGEPAAKNGLAALAIGGQLNASSADVRAWLEDAARTEAVAAENLKNFASCESSREGRPEIRGCAFAPKQAPCRPLPRTNERHKHESFDDEEVKAEL